MGLELINIEDKDKYLEYDKTRETTTNKWSFSRVKYFSKEPGKNDWTKITYYYGLKSKLTDYK